MNRPLAMVGNALEVMKRPGRNVGPTDLTRISLELAAQMIYLARDRNLDDARELAQQSCSTAGLPQVPGSH
jgi:thymidine phosphorylase